MRKGVQRACLWAGAVIFLAACGSETSAPAPEPTAVTTATPVEAPASPASPPEIDLSTGYFPVTLVPEPDLAWIAVNSMRRGQPTEGEGEIRLVVRGSVRMLKAGAAAYRFSLTDEEGTLHEDSGGVLLGPHEEGEEVPYETTISVPAGVTFFTSFNIRIEGDEEPRFSLHTELPLSRIPFQSP